MKIKGSSSIVFSGVLALLVINSSHKEANAAQDGEKDDLGFSMPCAQVLRLGRDKFEDVYTIRTHNSSTLGMNRGYDYYANCRSADNARRAQRLTASQQQQIKAIHDALSHLSDALYNIEVERAGGGTMYRVFATARNAGHEDLVGLVLDVLSHPKRQNRALQRRAAQRFEQSATTLNRRATLPVPGDPAHSSTENKRIYVNAITEAQQAVLSLRDVAAKLPAAAAWRLANQLHEEIKGVMDTD